MEKKKPELELPLPDQETFERVWRRVMPNQDLSPVAVGSPEQASDQEAVNAPGTQTPPSSSQTQEDGELLLALMDQASEGISGALTASGTMAVCRERHIPLAVTCGMGGIGDIKGEELCPDLPALRDIPVALISTSPSRADAMQRSRG